MKTPKSFKQTVIARIKPLNSLTALAFSLFYNTVRNDMRCIKLRYLGVYICATTCRKVIPTKCPVLKVSLE